MTASHTGVNLTEWPITQHEISSTERLATEILERVDYSPEKARKIGNELVKTGNLTLEIGTLILEYLEYDEAVQKDNEP